MRFGLLGDHPDGLELVAVLVASGRHQLVAYSTPLDDAIKSQLGNAQYVADSESILADPSIEAIVVAGSQDVRAEQLRRAMQSERHVLCVYPPDVKPDIGYEVSLIQKDYGFHLLPIVPEMLHPALQKFASLAGIQGPGELGSSRVIELEWYATGQVLPTSEEGVRGTLPIWFVLRQIGGEIQEVGAYTTTEEFLPDDPIFVQGLFAENRLFRALLLPNQSGDERRLRATCERGSVELYFPADFSGSAFLTWTDAKGQTHDESWDSWDPWTTLLPEVELALASEPNASATWEDCLHALELDDAARRSVYYRRMSVMEYPEATEEVTFKGTMVLAGCSLLWTSVFLLFLTRWFPRVYWLIGALVLLFLLLQILKYTIPREQSTDESSEP